MSDMNNHGLRVISTKCGLLYVKWIDNKMIDDRLIDDDDRLYIIVYIIYVCVYLNAYKSITK